MPKDDVRPRTSPASRFGNREGGIVVQFAVTLKGREWTVFKDGEVVAGDLTRSAAIEMAQSLAFEAEENGDPVELLVQDYFGHLNRKVTGEE